MIKLTAEKNKPAGKLRVAAYCRVSTDGADQKHSFAAQKRYFTELFRNSEHEELVRIYADSGSGTSMQYRPDMLRMLEDCRKGLIDRIVTKSLSRFARNTRECLCVIRELKRLEISVCFEKEAIDTANISDEIMITILEGLAQEESASISENIRWSLKKRMMNGTLGIARVPYGFTKENGVIIADGEKAQTVRRIFEMYLSGNGAKRIADQLNSEGLPSPTGGPWNNITILKMLSQEKYAGDILWQKTYSEFMGRKGIKNRGEQDSYYIHDALPAIVSREMLAAAEKLRQRNTRKAHTKNRSPFRGKTRCVCGRAYYYADSGRLPRWVCSGHYSPDRKCSCPSFYDKSYKYAWERACVKLGRFADEILLPCIRQMKALESESSAGSEEALRKRSEELNDRRYVLYILRSNGCISEEALVQSEFEINSELYEIRKKSELIRRQCDSRAERLSELYDKLKNGCKPWYAEELLIRTVSDGRSLEFELIGGLKIREAI